jgi:hypothetical protein
LFGDAGEYNGNLLNRAVLLGSRHLAIEFGGSPAQFSRPQAESPLRLVTVLPKFTFSAVG